MERLEVSAAVRHTHTHTHTYIYIYIYIYIYMSLGFKRLNQRSTQALLVRSGPVRLPRCARSKVPIAIHVQTTYHHLL